MKKRSNMKITIDTKEDTHEEIKKVIRMLSSLVGQEVMTNQSDLFSDDSNKTEGTDIFNMFDTSPETKTEAEQEEQKEEKEDIDIDIPDVEEYH